MAGKAFSGGFAELQVPFRVGLLVFALVLFPGCAGPGGGDALTLNNPDAMDVAGEGPVNIMGLEIEALGHASVKIKDRKVVYIDPFQLVEGGPGLEKADLILITHPHYDHCSVQDLQKIVKPETVIVTVPDCQSKISGLQVKEVKLIEVGMTLALGEDRVTAVPAYNVNKPNHPQENGWVGFILEMDGVKIYHAGDTDLIPEMQSIDVDIAFLPVGGTYTMSAKEAAEATAAFKRCKVAIPIHYGVIVGSASDAEDFKESAVCEVMLLR